MPQLGQVQPSKYMQINIKKDNGGWVKKKKDNILGFPGGPVFKNPPCNAGNVDLISGPGRFHVLWSN